jgi:hypothetical protein
VGLTAAAGTATWTIPLQLNLSVSLGGTVGTVAGVTGTSSAPAPAPAPAPGAAGPAAFRLEALERSGFNWQAAQAVERQARAWGFADCRFMDVRAAQGFLASTASLVLVSFCGTGSTADWLSNLRRQSQAVAGLGRVHARFWGQFSALREQLEELLQARLNLRSW